MNHLLELVLSIFTFIQAAVLITSKNIFKSLIVSNEQVYIKSVEMCLKVEKY